MGVDAVIQFETKRAFSDDDIKLLSHRIGDAFHYRGYADAKGIYFSRSENGRIEFDTLWRYYGVGYERGPLVDILGIIRFIRDYLGEKLLAIYYGGDCDVGITETTPQTEAVLWKHFVEVGHQPYLETLKNHPCPTCGFPMWKQGWSDGKDMYSCSGCGYSDFKKSTPNH